jgi:predicted metalloprotease with PDZ domain
MWLHFGQKEKGYTLTDYRQTVEAVAGQELNEYFEECIQGTGSLEKRLKQALHYVGCKLQVKPNEQNPGNIIVQLAVDPDRTAEAGKHLQQWIGAN